ncbi:PREDICTED: prolyl endopeptidase FAP, partial [Papilio polytes]|uniref:prolyl endopeptidase FAP n=1 Tax=Papilio polytes TaxID=76194 RepID=UPI00067692AE
LVLALIVTSVVLLTPPDEGPRVKGRRFRIQDLLTDDLVPVRWNGTWISGDEYVYKDAWGGISLMFAANQTSKTLMPNTTFRVLEPASFSLSADRRFLLLAQSLRQLHRHSYLARYTVYDILTTESYPLTPLPDEVGGGVITEGPYLLLAMWTPKGHGLITVRDYDIYYRPAPRSSTGYRVTDTGKAGTIYNGVPDWLYEEEILKSRTALWMSGDGHMVLYATFNDSLVREHRFPWYGPALDTDDPAKTYPEIRSVRYPKPGTNNPTVKLTVADIADPKHIRTRHLTPPKVILEQGDYYLTSAQWVSLTEVCVVWLTRVQNLSVVSVCKSPIALPLTHGSFDVVRLLAWDHNNQHIYYLGIPEGKAGQQHLYRVSAEAPRPGTPQKLPYCVTCNSQPSPSINLEYYGNLASSGESPWDADWDELPATSPTTHKKKKKKHSGESTSVPSSCTCPNDAEYYDSIDKFILFFTLFYFYYGLAFTRDSVLKSLNVFHCGLVLSPIVRWRYYSSAYAERYMGFPNATGNYRGYAEADVTRRAAALRDKMLLLVHGAADDVVLLQHSLALASALTHHSALFRQQIYPDEGHSLSGVRRHLYRTMSSFLDDCFRQLVPPETKAGLRNGGNLD